MKGREMCWKGATGAKGGPDPNHVLRTDFESQLKPGELPKATLESILQVLPPAFPYESSKAKRGIEYAKN